MEKAYKDNKIVEEMGHVTEISLKEKIKETEGTKCIILTKKNQLWKIILGKNGKIKERNKKKNKTRMKMEREYNTIQF